MNEANLDILERMLAEGIPPKVSDGKALINEVRRLKRDLDQLKQDLRDFTATRAAVR